jgi:hypothetical protein
MNPLYYWIGIPSIFIAAYVYFKILASFYATKEEIVEGNIKSLEITPPISIPPCIATDGQSSYIPESYHVSLESGGSVIDIKVEHPLYEIIKSRFEKGFLHLKMDCIKWLFTGHLEGKAIHFNY